ncbi:GNAT family N-acetyltransferase [Algoriphagus sp. PAP.12]|uniref:GNAT family N-acetyltransferase n=1 Tax=Algoriphagus sp. PAP.12 TaxID=2996678 RepID=UPI00227BCCB0|nr:GNAT family N-acetyltransferase [Algoriphagus sp. PAP.12]
MIKSLPFDSELFGYPVGKWDINQKWDESEFLKNSTRFQLIYIFSKGKLQIQDSSIQLVDTKITLQKEVGVTSNSDEVSQFPKKLNPKLETLAYESGIYSRFQTDTRLNSGEFKKLYKVWISEAINNQEVYITPNLEGMITLSFGNNEATIGLLAVAKEHKGMGWGRKLVEAAAYFAKEKGIGYLKVSTQEINFPAMRLYSSVGFKEIEKSFVYHYWNPNFS